MAYRCPSCGKIEEEPHQFLAHLSRNQGCKRLVTRQIKHYETQEQKEYKRPNTEERQKSQMAYA